MTDHPKNVRTLTDAEYQAAKRKIIADGEADRRAADNADDLRRIERRFATTKDATK